MMSTNVFTEIDVIRSKCLKDFSFFVRYFFKKQHGKRFTVNTHHEDMFDVAERINRKEITRLLFNIAPRYSKTEVMVKMFIAWSIALNPKARFIHLSYSDSLALDNSSEIKDIINSAEYQELFPYVQIKKDAKAKNKWYTTEGGGVLARSSAGQVTGFGAGDTNYEDKEITDFGGAIIIDDPLKPDDAHSEVLRERVNNKFNTTIRNRVNSEDTPIIIIMQRLHPQDLCGFLQEKEPDVWQTFEMPVIKEDGTALWESKHNIEQLEKMREDLGIIFETQYMQNPMPIEGYLMPKQLLRLLPNERNSDQIQRYCIIDPNEKNGDMMSAIFVQSEELEGVLNFHIYDVLHSNKGFEVNSEVIHQKCIDSKVNEVIFEKNGVGLATGMKLKTLNHELTYKLIPYHSTENKEAKILKNYEFALKHVSFNSNYEENREFKHYISDLTTYSSEVRRAHKSDAMDVLCSAVKIFKVKYKRLLSINA